MMTLTQQGDSWYLGMSYYMSSEPTRITNLFRVTWAEKGLTEGTAYRTGLQGVYRDSHSVSFNVEPTCEKQDAVSVPKPTTKLQTRWQESGWQKYSKSQGWISA